MVGMEGLSGWLAQAVRIKARLTRLKPGHNRLRWDETFMGNTPEDIAKKLFKNIIAVNYLTID